MAFVERRVGEQDKMVSSIRQTMVDLDRRLGDIDRHLVSLEDRMDRRFEGIDRRFDAVDARFQSIDDRLSKYCLWIFGVQVAILLAVVAALATQ